ncbi:MAG TPA: hypothetical protein VFL90_06295 [Methylomirabilota bacterium]|nr:hypothetical protein [Methylomirabilota bacterium]
MKVCAHCETDQVVEDGIVARHACARGCHHSGEPCPGVGHEPKDADVFNGETLRQCAEQLAWFDRGVRAIDPAGADDAARQHVLVALGHVSVARAHLELAAQAQVRGTVDAQRARAVTIPRTPR